MTRFAVTPPWLSPLEALQRRLFVGLALGVVAIAAILPAPSFEAQWVLLALGVLFFGVPHGAVDPWVALGRRGDATSIRAWVIFVLSYGALAVAVLLFWAQLPRVALGGFLAISAWHFGSADVAEEDGQGPLGRSGEILTRGATPILAPLFCAPDETLSLLETLGRAPLAALTEGVIGRGALLLWALARAASWASRAVRSARAADRVGAMALASEAATWALFATQPVLVAFLVTFCFDHSARHSLRLAANFDGRSPARGLACFARRALPGTLAVALAAAGAFTLRAGAPPAANLLEIVFVGLAALTIPHVELGMPRR